jgi:hypothetical protein
VDVTADGWRNYAWYTSADLADYAGRWIVVVDRRVVGSSDGSDLRDMLRRVRDRFPGKDSLLALVQA